MHVIIRCILAMASYTASEALELLLGEESGEETDIEEDPDFPLPSTGFDEDEDEDEDSGT